MMQLLEADIMQLSEVGQSPYVASPSRVSSLCSQVPSQVQVNTDKSQVKSKSWTFCFESQPSPKHFVSSPNQVLTFSFESKTSHIKAINLLLYVKIYINMCSPPVSLLWGCEFESVLPSFVREIRKPTSKNKPKTSEILSIGCGK